MADMDKIISCPLQNFSIEALYVLATMLDMPAGKAANSSYFLWIQASKNVAVYFIYWLWNCILILWYCVRVISEPA